MKDYKIKEIATLKYDENSNKVLTQTLFYDGNKKQEEKNDY